MGLFVPNDNERDLLASFFNEGAAMLGQEVRIQIAVKMESDFYNDPKFTYATPVDLDIIFDQNPQMKVLKDLHWYNEDPSDQPILAYIASKDVENKHLSPLRGSVIKIPFTIAGNHNTNVFEVSEIKGFGPNQVYWVCKLVPYRENKAQEIIDDNSSKPNQDDNFDLIEFKG